MPKYQNCRDKSAIPKSITFQKIELFTVDYLEPLGLSITKAAEGLGITRKSLSEIINGHYGISVEMSMRLSKAFNMICGKIGISLIILLLEISSPIMNIESNA